MQWHCNGECLLRDYTGKEWRLCPFRAETALVVLYAMRRNGEAELQDTPSESPEKTFSKAPKLTLKLLLNYLLFSVFHSMKSMCKH